MSVLALLTATTACEGGVEAGPPCTTPAPLLGRPDPRAPGYIVVFQPGLDAAAEAERLAARYGFTPRHLYRLEPATGFSADLSSPAVMGLRCEASVRYVEHNGAVAFEETRGG